MSDPTGSVLKAIYAGLKNNERARIKRTKLNFICGASRTNAESSAARFAKKIQRPRKCQHPGPIVVPDAIFFFRIAAIPKSEHVLNLFKMLMRFEERHQTKLDRFTHDTIKRWPIAGQSKPFGALRQWQLRDEMPVLHHSS